MGWGPSCRSVSVDLATSQKSTVTIRNSWEESRAPTGWPHTGQKLARSTGPLPQFGHIAMTGVYGRAGRATVLLVTVPTSPSFRRKPGTRNGGGWLGCRSGQGPSRGDRGGAGGQAEECVGLRAGAAAPGAGRRAGAGPGAAGRAAAGGAGAGRGQAGAHPGAVRAAAAGARPRPGDREPAGPAGPAPGRPGVRAGGAGPVRGRPQRHRGGGRALGGPPRPARRRAGPTPAPVGRGQAGSRGEAGPGGQEPTGRCSRSARTTSIPPVTSFTRLNSRVRSTVTMLQTTTPSRPMKVYQRNTVPAGKATSRLKLPAKSVRDVNTPMLTSTNQMTANTSRLISIRQK